MLSTTQQSEENLGELQKKAMIPVRSNIATTASEDYDKSWSYLEQYVDEVVSFSSSYSGQINGSYGPDNLRGAPKTFPTHSSSGAAWCPQTVNSNQHVVVKFKIPVLVTGVHIYETSFPGSVVKISCKREEDSEKHVEKKSILRKAIDKVIGKDEWIVLYERDNPEYSLNNKAVDFCPDLSVKGILSNTIRVDLKLGQNWSEIDAIKLVGKTKVELPKITKMGAIYKKMFNDALFTDLNIVHKQSGNTLKVHKSIVTARSEYFKVICESEMIESKTSIIEFEEDIPFDTFKDVVEFIYTNYINVNQENIYYIYLLADQFLIGSLSTYCGRLFSTWLEGENVFEFARIAKKLSCHKLNEVALEYIVDNYTTLFLTPQFEDLDHEEIIIICKRLAERQTTYTLEEKQTTISELTPTECSEEIMDDGF